MKKQRWWSGDPTEAYWLELTDRDDVGANLKAPLLGESGQEFWSYVLLREAKVGDIVFHYRTSQNAIIGASYIDGPAVEMPIHWGSRGAYFSPSWTAFQADRGRCFSGIVDGISV